MTGRQLGSTGRKWKAARLSAAGVLLVGVVFLTGLKAVELWQGEPFPVADPVTVAQRLDGQTQTIYDALQLPSARLDPDWPGSGIEATVQSCYARGLGEALNDSPPPEPGTAAVHESWALEGVPAAEAVEAMARARRTLTAAGWEITSSSESPAEDADLYLRPPATGDGVTVRTGVRFYPSGVLEVFAISECLRYPGSTTVDSEGKPHVPGVPTAPSALRSEPAPL
ncbi:hypothetical protein ABTX81_37955 [Kitasatospora sp. NPDC097605]|uniref:hypothetical protein n=1 Tax=Kitasatospora sp. NPDC097605 TaxID=3157226 RepID=UPI003331EAA7